MRTRISAGLPFVVALMGLALAGCATMPAERAASDDPLEPLNRVVLDVNTAFDEAVIRPVAETYRHVVPRYARERIRSVIDNFTEPRIFANDLLQGRADAADVTLKRFVINSTIGIAGLYDVASDKGFAKQTGDFGQTLYAWGVNDGPYLVLLFFGPSNFRDTVGLGVDLFTTPPGVFVPGHAGFVVGFVVGTVDGVDLRSRNIEGLDAIMASSLDYYSHLKSIAEQRRRAQLREVRGEGQEPPELTDPGAAAGESGK